MFEEFQNVLSLDEFHKVTITRLIESWLFTNKVVA